MSRTLYNDTHLIATVRCVFNTRNDSGREFSIYTFGFVSGELFCASDDYDVFGDGGQNLTVHTEIQGPIDTVSLMRLPLNS